MTMTPDQLANQRRYRKEKAERMGISQSELAGGTGAQQRIRDAKLRKRNHEHVLAIKASTPCADCGHTFPPVCMDFDHLPGEDKVWDVSKMVAFKWSLARIDAEIAKCELVCANCHRIRTAQRQGWHQFKGA